MKSAAEARRSRAEKTEREGEIRGSVMARCIMAKSKPEGMERA
jgi:hypothetical protein